MFATRVAAKPSSAPASQQTYGVRAPDATGLRQGHHNDAKPARRKPIPAEAMESRPGDPTLHWNFGQVAVLSSVDQPAPPRSLQTSPAAPVELASPRDPLEAEADRIADQIQHPTVRSATIGRARVAQPGPTPTTPRIAEYTPANALAVLRSPGEPLSQPMRAFMEPRFGQDFSRVRVHIGDAAARSAAYLDAAAFTVGHNIVFGAGRWSPDSLGGGRRLIAHELAHVVQQAGLDTGAPLLQRTPRSTPQVDPRADPGARDPLIRQPPTEPPVVEVASQGARSIDWSWEVQRPENVREQVYWAHFEVDSNGVMTASARMVSSSGQFRAPEWRLRDKFAEAVALFDQSGVRVRAFDAEWGYMNANEISGNLDAFFGSLRSKPGQNLADAAQATPSGKAAIGLGFSEVSILDIGYGVGNETLMDRRASPRTIGAPA